ncbi:MAG: DNA polymerase [Ilumatobacteraceae bacterium]
MDPSDLADAVRAAETWSNAHGVSTGSALGLALVSGTGLGLAVDDGVLAIACADPSAVVARIDAVFEPRWVWWDRAGPDALAAHGVTVDRCWDVLTVHRLLHGGWRTSIGVVWASLMGLDTSSLPQMGQLDLLGDHGDEGTDPDDPVRPDGHLRPEWTNGAWAAGPEHLASWAATALAARQRQIAALAERPEPRRARSTAHAESAAESLCAELAIEGLPVDDAEIHRIIAEAVGPRPADERDALAAQRARDADVLRHLDPGPPIDLRNPGDVRAMLRRVAVDVPDTRAWRLEAHRSTHPVVDALLTWRKAERIATTYGYRWLDEHVSGGRLHGEWTGSDGAAGRMTASAGLHNLPAEMRPAIAAEPGHVFVRADLGQIEPRVLAAVSGDPALVAATRDDDLYQPVADRLKVTREIAKVAVLGAMYGATTGESAHALRGLRQNYPVAMGVLEEAAACGRAGEDVFTSGGRRVRMWFDDSIDGDIDRARQVAAARGRFARNALIQGAAAEFFKVWAVIVRTRTSSTGGRIVLCLHDELLVHARSDHADETERIVHQALAEAAHHWSPQPDVRFLADTSVIARWSEAKA